MLRLLIRFLGLLLLAGGFAALVVDGTRSLASGGFSFTSLSHGAAEISPAGYSALQATIEQRLAPFIWDPIIVTMFLTPVSVAMGGVGALLILVSHKQERSLGFSRLL
jgi:hypothetical protein